MTGDILGPYLRKAAKSNRYSAEEEMGQFQTFFQKSLCSENFPYGTISHIIRGNTNGRACNDAFGVRFQFYDDLASFVISRCHKVQSGDDVSQGHSTGSDGGYSRPLFAQSGKKQSL